MYARRQDVVKTPCTKACNINALIKFISNNHYYLHIFTLKKLLQEFICCITTSHFLEAFLKSSVFLYRNKKLKKFHIKIKICKNLRPLSLVSFEWVIYWYCVFSFAHTATLLYINCMVIGGNILALLTFPAQQILSFLHITAISSLCCRLLFTIISAF